MDIEQTVRFILDTQAKLEASAHLHDERMARIEAAVEANTGRIAQLVDVSLSLAHHAEETDRRIRELAEDTNRRFQDTDYKLNALIETVDKLVRHNGRKNGGE
jgi:hypothetical protein